MTNKASKKNLSREQAAAIYDDLNRTMSSLLKKHQGKIPANLAAAANAKLASRAQPSQSPEMPLDENPALPTLLPTKPNRGHYAALGLVVCFALAKVSYSIMEATGLLSVAPAQASVMGLSAAVSAPKTSTPGQFSKEEVTVLTSLDHRRAELEERSSRLDERESELDRRDREFAARQTQLKELTDMLRADRDKSEKKRNAQLEQLANVYGSMNPPEAAALIEQLDVTIALELLSHMPEKRIGQILALMNPERALSITRMLSGKAEAHDR